MDVKAVIKSILQDEKVCYITGQTNNLHCHHIFRGVNRKISDKNGFFVYLAGWLHNQSDHGVHGKYGQELDLMLKRHCQMAYEKEHSREEFMALIGRNYLD
jgi:hypothetical protein